MSKEPSQKIQELIQRYEAAMHGMQTGVKLILQKEGMDEQYTGACSRKHLRVGVNSAMVDTRVIVGLLLKKGIITEEEFFEELAKAAEEERARYEKEVSALYPNAPKISLG